MQRKVSYVILPFFSFVFFSSWGYNVRPKPTVPRCVWVGRLRLTISWHKTGQAVHESGERRACGHRLTPLGTSRPHGSSPKKTLPMPRCKKRGGRYTRVVYAARVSGHLGPQSGSSNRLSAICRSGLQPYTPPVLLLPSSLPRHVDGICTAGMTYYLS